MSCLLNVMIFNNWECLLKYLWNVNVCKLLIMTIKIKNIKTYKNKDLPIYIQKKYHKFRKLYLCIN